MFIFHIVKLMENKNIFDTAIIDYCIAKGVREHPAIQKLREYSAQFNYGRMLITPIQGNLLNLLIKIANSKNILEIGTYTGYSAAWIGLALANDGKLTTLDINHRYIECAEQCWNELGIKHKIQALQGDALDYMNTFIQQKQLFDLVFIDANKSQYIDYYELSLQLVRPNGLIIIDNVLMYGHVLSEEPHKKYLKTLQKLNDIIATDERVEVCMLPVGDGFTIARKIDI